MAGIKDLMHKFEAHSSQDKIVLVDKVSKHNRNNSINVDAPFDDLPTTPASKPNFQQSPIVQSKDPGPNFTKENGNVHPTPHPATQSPTLNTRKKAFTQPPQPTSPQPASIPTQPATNRTSEDKLQLAEKEKPATIQQPQHQQPTQPATNRPLDDVNLQVKLQHAEKEIRELRKQNEKLINKLKRISHMFNDLRGVIDEDLTTAPGSKSSPQVTKGGSSPPTSTPLIPTAFQSFQATKGDATPLNQSSQPTLDVATPSSSPQVTKGESSPLLVVSKKPPSKTALDELIVYTSTPGEGSPIISRNSTPNSPLLPEPSYALLRHSATIPVPESPGPFPPVISPTVTPTPPGETATPSPPLYPIPIDHSSYIIPNSPQITQIPPETPPLQRVSSKDKVPSPRSSRGYLTRLFGKDEIKHKANDMMNDRREIIILQFLKAEKSYCYNLNLIVEAFLKPLRHEIASSNTPVITHSNLQQIFSHIEVILGSSKLLVEDVQARVDGKLDGRPVMLGDLFVKATDYFRLYTPYLSGYCQALTVLSTCKADNNKFLMFIRERERQLDSEFKDLGSLLVLPVMRISQYTLFIEELLETTPDDNPDSDALKEALKKMKSVVEYVKEKSLEYESQSKVQQIQSMLTGKFQNLNLPHRRYIMEGALQEISGSHPRDYYCFLFNDILLIAKQRKKQFEYRSSIDLLHMEIHTPQDLDGKAVFTINPVASISPLLHNPISSSLVMLGSPANTKLLHPPASGAVPELFVPILDSPINSGNSIGASLTLNSSSGSVSPPNANGIPTLMFCVASHRDRDNWVHAITDAIEQERKMEKRKSVNVELSSGSPIGSGGFINFDNSVIELQEMIAQGGGGCKIHRCTIDGYTCVAKILNVKGKSKESVVPFITEITIIEQLRHQNIAKYLGHRFTKNSDRMWLFMEYCPCSLETILERRKGVMFPPKDVAWIALEIAKGIEFLHTQKHPIIHRDLKCGNILCTLNEHNEIRNVKVTDFDTSKVVTKGVALHTCVGTTAFMAPEVLDVSQSRNGGYTLKADIFSFGMLLVELITLHPPFYQYESIQVAELVISGRRPELPIELPQDMEPIIKFILHCTEYDPDNRPSSTSAVTLLTKILKDYISKPSRSVNRNGLREAKLRLDENKVELIIRFYGETKYSETGVVYTFDNWKTMGEARPVSFYGGAQPILIDLSPVTLPAELQFAAYLKHPYKPTEWDSKFGVNYKARITKDAVIPLNYF